MVRPEVDRGRRGGPRTPTPPAGGFGAADNTAVNAASSNADKVSETVAGGIDSTEQCVAWTSQWAAVVRASTGWWGSAVVATAVIG